MNKKINNNQLRKENNGEVVKLYGWVQNIRKFKDLIFVDLRDRWGITQLVINSEKINTNFTKESVLEIEGVVAIRKEKNPLLKTGDIEILVDKLNVLSLSKELPFQILDEIDTNEELRLKYRYLDLRRNKLKENLLLKNQIIKHFRDFLHNQDFIDLETPILSKSTPEGARDFLVPTRNEGKFFALPQSPQLYKQLLMASGFEKYYQFARVFRDEDLRKDRQYEFTQLDLEMAFQDEKSIQAFLEKMFHYVFKKIGKHVSIPFARMDFDVAIDKYGTDKPDLRYENLLEDGKSLINKEEFLFNFETIKTLFIEREISKKEFKILDEIARKNKANRLLYLIIENGKIKNSSFKINSFELLEKYIENKKYQSGTLFLVADKYENSTKALGAVRVELNEMFNLAKEEFNFVWIVNWPMFEYDEEKDAYAAAHHPFTMIQDQHLNNFEKDKKGAKAKAYDLVLNGFELGSGSIRIYDTQLQKKVFKAIGMSEEEARQQFGFFLNAFDYGLPPHGGMAFGIDRILMIITKSESIRDVIPFPVNSKGINVMAEAPSNITQEQLNEYSLVQNKNK